MDKRLYTLLKTIIEKIIHHTHPPETPAVDYVTEQGESGIWLYRKWKSGMRECWGHVSTTGKLSTSKAGLYMTPAFAGGNYPAGLFTVIPERQVTSVALDETTTIPILFGGSATTFGNIQLARGNSNASVEPKYVYMYACQRY